MGDFEEATRDPKVHGFFIGFSWPFEREISLYLSGQTETPIRK
jgi:hypothetical protein